MLDFHKDVKATKEVLGKGGNAIVYADVLLKPDFVASNGFDSIAVKMFKEGKESLPMIRFEIAILRYVIKKTHMSNLVACFEGRQTSFIWLEIASYPLLSLPRDIMDVW